MKDYLFYIKSRLHTWKFPILLLSWHTLLIKKIFKYQFSLRENNLNPVISIDIVIPTTPRDIALLEKVIEGVRTQVRHTIKNIYVISPEHAEIRQICLRNHCVFIEEKTVLGYGTERVKGWIFQQLLKFGSSKVVTEKYFLVIDDDTFLLNPHTFIETVGEKNTLVLYQSNEWHQPYFNTFKQIFTYPSPAALSHIAHMMIFEKESLEHMKKEIEITNKKPWDEVIIDLSSTTEHGFSEYETYAGWMLKNNPSHIAERPFYNKGLSRAHLAPLQELRTSYGNSYNSVSFHHYLID